MVSILIWLMKRRHEWYDSNDINNFIVNTMRTSIINILQTIWIPFNSHHIVVFSNNYIQSQSVETILFQDNTTTTKVRNDNVAMENTIVTMQIISFIVITRVQCRKFFRLRKKIANHDCIIHKIKMLFL